MMAIAGLVATSCQDNLAPVANEGEIASVSFQVETPEIATRAYSDGMSATVLQYAVYDEAGKEISDLTVTDAVINGKTTVELKLTTGHTYSMIFWAAAPEAPYTVDLTAKTMTVDYTEAVSNDENRDAFYKYVEPFVVTGTMSKTVELKRPFAQLNIGTNDYAASEAAGYAPAESYVTVPVYSTLDLVEGEVSGQTTVTYEYAAIPEGETFPVAGYDYVAMNYLLVPSDKEVVEVEFGVKDDAEVEKTRTVGSVPVQRNYRTNIYGTLLTSGVIINVEILPDYDGEDNDYKVGDYNVATAEDLQAAVNEAIVNGTDAEIVLDADVTLTQPLVIGAVAQTYAKTRSAAAVTIVINGQGNTLSYSGSGSSARAIDVKSDSNGANLTFKDLTIDCTSSYCQRGINYNTTGTLVLDGVTVKGQNVTYALNLPGSSKGAVVEINNSSLTANIALNVWGANSKVTANDSDFTSVDNSTDENYTAIALNDDGATAAEGAVVTINGGTITAKDQDGEPSSAIRNSTKTGRVDVSSSTVVVGKSINPVAIITYGGDQFYSSETLQGAILKAIETKAVSVRLISDIELAEPVTVAEGGKVTIDMNGYTLTTGEKSTGRHHYAIDNYGTMVIEGEGAINARGIENFGTMTINGDITITNVDTNGGSAIWNEGDLTINAGTYTTNAEAGVGSYGGALYTEEGATCVVNGGTFIANSQLTYAVLNYGVTVVNNATVKGKHGAIGGARDENKVYYGKTTINGGTFELMENPNMSDHCAYCINDIRGGKFTLGVNTDSGAQLFYDSVIAEGYKTVEENGWTSVVAE